MRKTMKENVWQIGVKKNLMTKIVISVISSQGNPMCPVKNSAAMATSRHIIGGFGSRAPAALSVGLAPCDVVDVVDTDLANVELVELLELVELFPLVRAVLGEELGALEAAVDEAPEKEKVVSGPMISEGSIVKVWPPETIVVGVLPSVIVWLPKIMIEGPRTVTGMPSILAVVIGPAGTFGARVPAGKAKVVPGPMIADGLIVKVRPSETSVVGVLPSVIVWPPKRMLEGPSTTTGTPAMSVVIGPTGAFGARVPVGKANVAPGPMIADGLIVKVLPSETIVLGVLPSVRV
jgi:hypothetical protein